MDKTRTLPPLVRGRVTKVLEFFVDKIKFFRNILLLTENFDLVLQVQWWGESLPALIRPKELQVADRILKMTQSSKSSYHSEKYEIKTTSELFQSYLKTCEVLELSVLEAVENYVIGSAFLRNLINLFKNNNELISMPIFDYLGEIIGEVIIHVNFLEKTPKKFEVKQNKNTQLDLSVKKSNCDMFSIPDDYLCLGEKILYYDGRIGQKHNEELQTLMKSTREEKTASEQWDQPLVKQDLVVRSKSSSESLPNIKTISDTSKVLYFGKQQPRPKSETKNTQTIVPSKFSCNSIKCKSKSKLSSEQSGKDRKKITSSTNFTKKQSNLREVVLGLKQTNLQNYTANENPEAKVLDYLFGCDMSKDTELKALNDFKNMSPSHNLVDSISQLCLVSNNSLTCGTKPPVHVQQSQLNFDFNNPIERDYYEKFFTKPNSCSDFEIAEFLNQPDNSFKLGKSESKLESKNHTELTIADEATKNYDDIVLNISDKAKNCARCKYYKKLSELDVIIESLKNFEQKIIMHEKNSQNLEILAKPDKS